MTTHWRACFHVLSLALFLCLAATGMARAAAPDPIFVPTSAWLVGPASLAVPAGGGKLPCIMANQFDNGFTLRVSGGGGKVFALAIDVRQNVFTPAQTYPVALRLGKEFSQDFEGVAYNAATLIVNTQQSAKLYDALRDHHSLAMDIAEQTFEFAVLGADDGFKRLEACYEGKEAQGEGSSSSRSARAAPPSENAPVPGLKTSAPHHAADDVVALEPAAGTEGADEDKAVRTAWQPPPAKGGKPRDILTPGSAVPPEAGADVQKRWRAMKGASLRDVLEIWSENAEADLVWTSDDDFPVKKSVISQGTLEEAVLELLQQYNEDKARPVGKLYNDPSMNRRVLLIRAEDAS